MRGAVGLLVLAAALDLLIFIVALPGFGIETRTVSDYKSWGGPIFLLLTVILFASGVAALVTSPSRPGPSARFALLMAAAGIVTVLLDDSGLAGKLPPAGPY